MSNTNQANTASNAPVTLTEFGNLVREGNLSEVNGKLIIDLDQVTKADFHTLLQLVRHKSFGHELLRRAAYELDHQTDDTSIIDALRVHNHNGEFDRTLAMLEGKDSNVNYELLLEKARALMFLGRHEEVLALIPQDKIEQVPVLSTQGVLFQLLGWSRLETGEMEAGRIALLRALDICKTIGNKAGEIGCHMYLSKYYGYKGDFEGSQAEIAQTQRLLREIRNFRWLLGYYRTLSHHQFLAGSSLCFGSALTGALIARSIQDETYFVKGMLEFLVMQKKFRLDFFSDDNTAKEILNSPLIANDAELSRWKELAETGICSDPKKTTTIRAFEKGIGEFTSPTNDWNCPSLKSALSMKWVYDASNGVLIDLGQTSYEFLAEESPLARLITHLNEVVEPVPMPQAFQYVWNIPWQPHRHENTVKVSIGRIGRMSPSVKVRRKNKALTLEQKGLVI